VALLTVGGISHGLMVGIAGLAKSAQVAALAFGGESKSIELTDRSNLVAGVAVYGCVSADQREAILVLVDVVNGNLPAIGVMAKFALSTVLATMQIGVAILAPYWCVAENQILVAIGALHFGVPAAQRKLRVRMIEFELSA
jgi:hypothetical protein